MNPLLFLSFITIIFASAVACAIGVLILAHAPQGWAIVPGGFIVIIAGAIGTLATLLFGRTIATKDT